MRRGSLASSSLLLLLLLLLEEVGLGAQAVSEYSRDDFPPPPDFVFGSGTSAYQWEGAAAEDGRGPSIWDTFTHSGMMPDKSTGDVASDGYHKYKEDVKLMAKTGLEAYKFSISWSRVLPNGRGAVNPKGLKFYNNLINELVEHGIEPHVSLYHLDLPQVLEDEYGGWLSPKIVDDFAAYADVCFREFGDRVIRWTTLIEPNILGTAAYDSGGFPPNRCSYPYGFNCNEGNSTVEPYIAVHNLLLAHASAVKVYREKYQDIQKGWIGANVYSFWYYPFTNSTADVAAAQRALDFQTGWILDPLVFGDYPEIMKKNAGSRLPSFTKSQSELVKGSFDFIGVNHYFSLYVKDNSNVPKTDLRDYNGDIFAAFALSKNDTPDSKFYPTHITFHPDGMRELLEYLKENYGNPPIYIDENGYGLGVKDSLNDTDRINYLSSYIGSMLDAVRNGTNVRGYFVWSFVDLFELVSGYTSSLGLYDVNFEDEERERQPKLSAHWYSNFLKKNDGLNIKRTGLYKTPHADS